MKKLIFVIAALLLIQSTDANAQRKKFYKREVALISYNLDIDEGYKQKFESFAGEFRQLKNNELSPIANQIYYSTWDLIKQTLESQTGMFILPIDAYGKKFSYNDYGFPNTSASKAINKGESKYYLKIDLSIKPELETIQTTVLSKPDSTKVALGPNQIQPIVKIEITIFSDKGIIPVCKTSVETKSLTAIEVNSALFDGFSNEKYTNSPINIYGLFQNTLAKLVGSIFENIK